MRVLIWGINYSPEVTGIAVYNQMLAEWLAARGHEVEMVTTFAYYPAWKKAREDHWRWARSDHSNKVYVHRCWHYVPRRVTALKRMAHEASFVATSLWKALRLKRTDVAVVVSPPLALGAAAWLFSKLKGTPYVFHVQDLQPDAAVGLGMLKPGLVTKVFYKLEAFAYAKANAVSGISEGMLEAYHRKGVPEAKTVFFPNPVSVPEESAIPPRGAFRAAHGIESKRFVALYSGNLGVKQGLSMIINAAELMRKQSVLFVICGDGAKKADLVQAVEERRLSNVIFLPLQPKEQFWQMLVDADVCLVTQQKGSGASFFPSKLLSILSLGRPALTVADRDSALYHAVENGGFGINVEPGAPAQLAAALQRMAEGDADPAELGRKGRAYVARFEVETVIKRFEETLRNLAETGQPKSGE